MNASGVPWYPGTGYTGQSVVIAQPSMALFQAAVAALPGIGWTRTGFLSQDDFGNYTQMFVRYVQFPATYWQTLPLPYQKSPVLRNFSGVGQTIIPGQAVGLGSGWIGNR